MLGFRRGAGDGGGRSAVTVYGNEATRLESARGGGGIRAPARSLVVLNGNKQPRLRNSDSLTRSTSTMSRSVTRSECVPGRHDDDSRAPGNRRRDSAPSQRRDPLTDGLAADSDSTVVAFRKMDDFRIHVWEDTSFDGDEAIRRPQVIDSFASSDDTLSDTAASGVQSSIKIGSRVWKLGESISSIGTAAVSKSKLRDSFGDAWAHASVTGIILGKGAKKKIRVRWTNLKDTEDTDTITEFSRILYHP